jgi:hypothetical protein
MRDHRFDDDGFVFWYDLAAIGPAVAAFFHHAKLVGRRQVRPPFHGRCFDQL